MSWTTDETLRGLTSPFVVGEDVDVESLAYTRFAALVTEGGLQHVATWRWATRVADLAAIRPLALASGRGRRRQTALLDLELEVGRRALVYVNLSRGVVWAEGAADRPEDLDAVETWLRAQVPQAAPSPDQRVPVGFWSSGAHGPRLTARTVEVPSWPEIAANYPGAACALIEPLVDAAWRPEAGGRLLLWHGPPGTGKTTALRALAWEWREWAALQYVTDPERFFGSADYMLDVLLAPPDDDGDEDGDDGDEPPAPRWRLLVLEDTGELLSADAKERTGQGLSRLLNVVDGLIGQGLRVLVLVTTNEPLAALHPAVARPGRCLALVEFPVFAAEEARSWLAARGCEEEVGGATLAELYAVLDGRAPARRPREIGFGVR